MCMYLLVFGNTYVYGYKCTCVHIHIELTGCLSQFISTLYIKVWQTATCQSSLPSQFAPESPCLCFPSVGITHRLSHPLGVDVGAGIQTLFLTSVYFYPLSYQFMVLCWTA